MTVGSTVTAQTAIGRLTGVIRQVDRYRRAVLVAFHSGGRLTGAGWFEEKEVERV